jgi:CDP-diacylglycerol--glycerol-3-phosphate 3-phosphatidyltransferase
MVSLLRPFAALLFASVAFQRAPLALVLSLYGIAMGSDLVDGFLARRFRATSYFGTVLDLVSDKSLTVVSLLYAAARGINILPLSLIATREIVMIGMRLITVNGTALFQTNRAFGGVMALALWGNTLLLILVGTGHFLLRLIGTVYWGCALALMMNMIARLLASRQRLRAALSNHQESA